MIPIVVPAERAKPGEARRVDQRVVLRGVPWETYEALLASRGESAVPRVTYDDGELEIMAPSRDHETLKTLLGRLVEAFAEERRIDLNGAGSWTLKEEAKQAGLEPDECYIVGDREVDRPDFAIEVVWTTGGLPKLEVYRKLGVREVWFFEDGALRFFVLRGRRFAEVARSEVIPSLDPALLVSLMGETNQTRAVRAYRSALREER